MCGRTKVKELEREEAETTTHTEQVRDVSGAMGKEHPVTPT